MHKPKVSDPGYLGWVLDHMNDNPLTAQLIKDEMQRFNDSTSTVNALIRLRNLRNTLYAIGKILRKQERLRGTNQWQKHC